MKIGILILILVGQDYFGIASDFPILIESCLNKLVMSDARTGAASTDVIHKCLVDSGANFDDWDHPWIVSLYRGVFEAVLCERKQNCSREKRVRREYRQLSDDERREYHTAMLKLHNDTTVAPNKFMALVLLHRDFHADVAHGGPPFVIWHRIYISMFEEALRQISPDVTVPYWDMTIDQRLEDAAKSNIWTSEFIGNGFGKINQGIFKDWSHDRGYVTRYLGESFYLPSERAIKHNVDFPYTELESLHNTSHAFVGGDMQDPNVSPSDPVFWVLHCFYDMVWQEYIEKNTADGRRLVSTYPESHVYPLNRTLALMPLSIGGALDANFLLGKHIFQFAPRPSCSVDNSCNSRYLECDRDTHVCRPTHRVCVNDDGPSLDAFCNSVNCTSDWMHMEITIRANYSNVKARCNRMCSNAIQLNIYTHGKRQHTVLLKNAETNSTGIRLRILTKKLNSIPDLQVIDSCARPCGCYILSQGKYTPCDPMSINNSWITKELKAREKQPTRSGNQTLFAFRCGEDTK